MSNRVGDDETSKGMRKRVPGGRPMFWFLVGGNRLVVSSVMLAALYALVILLARVAPGSVSKLIDPDPVFALFTPIVIGIIMGVSLVLTFNQLVLSQELGPIGDQRERMSQAMTFREDVEEVAELETSPPDPATFLRALLGAAERRARSILEAGEGGAEASEDGGTSLPEPVRDYAEQVAKDADRVSERMEDEQFGGFGVIGGALHFDYSRKIYDGRRLRNRHADDLSDDARRQYDELLDVLEFFGPAREHFKTLYFRWEIIDVSRTLVYVSLPALAVAAYMLLIFQASDVTGTTAGLDHALLVVCLGLVVGVQPFAIFLAYILRIVTVAKWTLAIGPFILRETERDTKPNRK